MNTKLIYIGIAAVAVAASVATGSCEKPAERPDPDGGKTVTLTVRASVEALDGGPSSEINWGGDRSRWSFLPATPRMTVF